MALIIKLQALADGRPSPIEGMFLRYCDFEARGGRGVVYGTPDRNQALLFADAEDALNYWRYQSKEVPLRDDGEPNRPLTSYTVSVEPFEEAVP